MRHILTPLFLATAALPAAAEETGHGQSLYLMHCAACHGTEGKADGPMAPLLTIATPDLTGLSAGNDGNFPLGRVVQTIDGRIELRGHGGPMLVYGQILGGGSAVVETEAGGVLETRGDIVSIAEFLETIQEE